MAGSEVAKLRQQLDEICVAMRRGLYDYANVGKHEIITHKYEMLGETQERLALHVGNEQAFMDVLDALDRGEKQVKHAKDEEIISAKIDIVSSPNSNV